MYRIGEIIGYIAVAIGIISLVIGYINEYIKYKNDKKQTLIGEKYND